MITHSTARIISALIVTFLADVCFAQKSDTTFAKNSFQLSLSLNQLKEENLQSIVHSGPAFGLSYSRMSAGKRTKHLGMELNYSRPKTKFESLPASLTIQLSLNYSFLIQEYKTQNYFLKFGPELRLRYNLSYYPNWGDSHLYWADKLAMGLHTHLQYRLTKERQLITGLSIPLFSAFSRPEASRLYKIDDVTVGGVPGNMHSQPTLALWGQSFFVTMQMEYRLQLNDRIAHAICYSFDYTRIKKKEEGSFQNLRHLIGFKLYY